MAKEQYYYAVTRVHGQEAHLLSEEDLQQLLETKSYEDSFSILTNKGWGSPELPPYDAEALITYETQKTWDFLSELVEDITPFCIFRYSHDFNNLKAVIKANYVDYPEDMERLLLPFGTVEAEQMIEAAQTRDFKSLPEPMAQAAEEATRVLYHTQSGQNSDIILDVAALHMIYEAGMASGSELFKEYVTTLVDVANIKTVVRASGMGRPREFLERATVNLGSLNLPELISRGMEGVEAVCEFLSTTAYKDACASLAQSLPAFEAWCDSQIIRRIRPHRHSIGGLEPLAAYLLARENEISMVKLVLAAKRNNIDSQLVKQRMREMYV